MKNNKYFMMAAKRDLESMFKLIWQKIYTE